MFLIETLGEYAPSYATIKNWVVHSKRGNFSTCDAPRPGQPKTLTTPQIIDQIHELILEDCRILAKSIAEQLGISRERFRSIIHEELDETWLYHYDPGTKQQSMESRHSGSPSPTQKNSECKNPLEKFLPRFFGIKTASSSLIIFQRAKLSSRSIANLYWCK